jgi:protein-disulfide isomerase
MLGQRLNKATISNRLVFLLACVGAFVALVLAIAHIGGAKLPCGAETAVVSGCDKVQMDAWSKVFGVPVAFFGLLLYLVVALGAGLRESRGLAETRGVGVVLWALLAAGTLASVVLLSHAHFRLHATCVWCLASGIIMALALVAQTASMAQTSSVSSPGTRGWGWRPLVALPALALAIGGAYGWMLVRQAEAMTFGKEVSLPEGAVLVRPGNASRGPEDAPVLVVAFSDLHCPPCREAHLRLEEEMRGRLRGKVRLVMRHYPLKTRHPDALGAAVLAEWAKSKGRFWEFVTVQFLNQAKTKPDEMVELVRAIGLDAAEAKRLLADKTLQARFLKQVDEDLMDAKMLGVESTPTWFVRYPDGTVATATAQGVFGLLSEEQLRLHAR